MKKLILSLVFIAAVLVPSAAKNVKGKVCCEGKPLSGVIVSDGYRFTKTLPDGTFAISTAKDARFVFVVTPSGYVADFSSGVPAFYLPIKGTRAFNFNLQKVSDSEDYTIFSVSDPQMQNKKHIRRFNGKPLGDLRGMAAVYSAERPTVGIALGDVAWNKLGVFEDYKKSIALTGIPFYAVIGNHDFIQNRDGIAAGEAYESAFGPYNYAFFIGKDLVIGLNNLIFKGSGNEDPEKSSNNYVEGYSDEALGFVKGLLNYVPAGTHIYMAQHSPIRFIHETKSKFIDGADKMLALLDGYTVDILSGHTHVMNRIRVAPNVEDHNAAAIGGAWWATTLCRDGSPRGYEIISSVAGEVSWKWHCIDIPDDRQVEFYGMDKCRRHRNSVVANAWYADSTWTAEYYEDGKFMGTLPLCREYSPAYTDQINGVYSEPGSKIPGYKKPTASRHYFAATPSQYASIVEMTVKSPTGESWSHTFDLRGSYIDLQAHRGGAGLMPENTMSSMKKAMDMGMNTLEFDLQLSGDGKVVVSHDNYFHPRYSMRPDSTLIQKDDPKEYLYTMPYDSIAKYDVGLRYVERWPTQKKISEHKPLASDLIDFTEKYAQEKGMSPFRYNIEIKSREGEGEGTLWPSYEEFCDVCIPLLLSKDLGDRLVVQSFDVRALEYIHKKYPQVELSYLTEYEKEITEILANLSFKPRWWSPHYSVVTAQNVAYCHALGIKVVPWTVDEPKEIARMAKCAADAIISNYPDRLISEIR